MTDDIVTRLQAFRECIYWQTGDLLDQCVAHQIADDVERLRAERDHWRKVADICVMAIGVPENDVDRVAMRHYDEAVRGD